MRSLSRVVLLSLAGLFVPMCLYARDASRPPPEPLPASVLEEAPSGDWRLLGFGHFRKLLWDVFDASLWVPGEHWTQDEPFVLAIRYVRNFEGKDIVEGTRRQWKHLGFGDTARTEAWLQLLTGIFPDIKQGDQLQGLHLPGRETRFFHNGRPIGIITDPDFGTAFFAIWLDPKTSEPILRENLLGLRCDYPEAHAQQGVGVCGGATMSSPSARRQDGAHPE